MMEHVHNKVTSFHLKRDAYLYIRQSTLKQVFENSESTKRQYALKERAISLGWPIDRIHVIDADQGHSGSSSVDRIGFQKLVADVGLGKVGIVLGLEVSRLARNSTDWHRLIEICALSKTLILDEDGVYDPCYFNDRLLLGLKGTMSEAELHILRDRLQGGIISKAKRAELEVPIPCGFIRFENGKINLDPDQQVQKSIKELFKIFRQLGSASGVVKYFSKHNLKFPRRIRSGPQKGDLKWEKLKHSRTLRILHNPCYAGVYSYGKSHTQILPLGKMSIKRLPQEDWIIFKPNAHPGYISFSEFQENQEILKKNALAIGYEHRSPPREGPALLQGLVICGVCGRRMTIRYHVRKNIKYPDYTCQAKGIEYGTSRCQSIHGANIDLFIGKIVGERLTPDSIKMVLTVEEDLREQFGEVKNLLKKEVQRAKYESELSERRYRLVDPDNRLVASTLEADWNEKLKALAEAEDNYQKQRDQLDIELNNSLKLDFLNLPEDFKKIWDSNNTTYKDKKRMIQLLLEDVTLISKGKIVEVKIRFKGGKTEIHSVNLPPSYWTQLRTSDNIATEVDQLIECHTLGEIADILNRKSLKTGRSKRFNSIAVIRLIRSRKLVNRYTRYRRMGLLTKAELAQKYDVSVNTVTNWYKSHLIITHAYDSRNRYLCEDPGKNIPIKIGNKWCLPRKSHKAKGNNQSSKISGGVV